MITGAELYCLRTQTHLSPADFISVLDNSFTKVTLNRYENDIDRMDKTTERQIQGFHDGLLLHFNSNSTEPATDNMQYLIWYKKLEDTAFSSFMYGCYQYKTAYLFMTKQARLVNYRHDAFLEFLQENNLEDTDENRNAWAKVEFDRLLAWHSRPKRNGRSLRGLKRRS